MAEKTGLALAVFEALKGSGGGGTGITDVQVNGTSVVTDGVANVPVASTNDLGVAKVNTNYGIGIYNNQLQTALASAASIKGGEQYYQPIVPFGQHISVFYGLAKIAGADEKNSVLSAGTYTETAKSAISAMLNAPETVTGTTPTIPAMAGVQYVCGEVSTLDITPPASGCFDVIFESGSTPTALTISNPTGTTVEWLNGFDSTSLSANAVYEINLLRVGTKYLGVAGAWS